MKKVASTAILSILCGSMTAVLGLFLWVVPCGEKTQIFWVFLVILVNFVLHVACYIHSLKERPQASILSISVVEAFLAMILLLPLFGGTMKGLWEIYAFYLVVNGASLVAMLSKFSIGCGICAIISGGLVFFMPGGFTVALSLVVNGAERVLMAALAIRKKKEFKG